MFLSVLSLACIIFFDFKVISILGFIIMLSLPTLIFLSIDIFLEKISKDKNTGEIRGKYLAFLNSAFIIGPIISSVILLYSDMKAVYLFSLVLLIIVLIIGAISFRKFQDPEYTKVDIKKGIIKVWNNNNLRNLFGAGLSLNIFYAVMVIYVPVYLISKMDFSLSQVALMIAIALVPFVILQSYLGKMADKVFGEKEIMIAGFAIMGLILILAGIWQSPVWLIWTIILFVSRIGASMVEVMTETYLFKKINAEEIDIISIYRIMYPIGYLIVPFLGFFITGILDYRFLFILTAIFLLTYGIKFAVRIRDTL
jgi:MFS family permease